MTNDDGASQCGAASTDGTDGPGASAATRTFAGVPGDDVDIPARLVELAGDDALEAVWRNELGGLTVRIRGREAHRYIKWQPPTGLGAERDRDVDLVAEAERLRWAGDFIRVPRVVDVGVEGDASWLMTEAIDARSAFDPRWRDSPELVVRAMARGLRRMHDALPVDACPYRGTWLGSKATLAPEPERLVVCHGDPCVPNTLLDDSGEFAGHVDLARLGAADRWADLSIATYSISWNVNFGRDYDELFFRTYGIEPDRERIRAYRRLWDAA
ncbi:MAG: phosphotransferase [Microbacterium sp.]